MININKIVLMLVVFFCCISIWEGNAASSISIQDSFSKAKVGTSAPKITLINLKGKEESISFYKPTVLLHLNHYQNEIDPNQYNDLYKKWKGKVNFYIVADSRNKDLNKIFNVAKLSVPILLEKENEFTRKYNQLDPSLVIIDGKGIIRYNSSAYIVVKELDSYLEKLVYEKIEKSPEFSSVSIDKFKKTEVPKLLLNGEQAGFETFKTVENKDFTLKFEGQPTVMLIWLSISSINDVRNKMDIMQAVYEKSQGKVRFLSVAGSDDKKVINYMTNGWNYSIPVLRLESNKQLRYARGFPAFVIIDKYGKVVWHIININTQDDLLQVTKMLCE